MEVITSDPWKIIVRESGRIHAFDLRIMNIQSLLESRDRYSLHRHTRPQEQAFPQPRLKSAQDVLALENRRRERYQRQSRRP